MAEYELSGQRVSPVELKALLVSRGVRGAGRVYDRYAARARLSTDPLQCNTMLLPDDTVVQLTDLAFHMSYIRSVMSWTTVKQLRYLTALNTPFRLDLDTSGEPVLFHEDAAITPVRFPPATDFYSRHTSTGLPFLGNAVLQGTQWVSFPLLWSCDYATEGAPCQYCYSGGELQALARKHKPLPRYPTPDEVAEIVEHAVDTGVADSVQITGGSTFDTNDEYARIGAILATLGRDVGRDRIGGEIVVYATPPEDPRTLDQVFAAGADRIAMSLEIWDPDLARRIMPGKIRHTGRRRHLDALEYVAATFGPNRACSNFIVGLESAESLLAGAEVLAAKGIVPIASVWIPFGRPVLGSMIAPDLDYYRTVITALADTYRRHGITPPGGRGLNVCMDRDIQHHART